MYTVDNPPPVGSKFVYAHSGREYTVKWIELFGNGHVDIHTECGAALCSEEDGTWSDFLWEEVCEEGLSDGVW